MTDTPARDRIVASLEREREAWRDLVAEVGADRMDEPGPMGDWSFRDLAAHLMGWRERTIARLEAAADGAPDPADPWPAELNGLDDDAEAINDWIQEQYVGRPTGEILEAIDASFGRLASVLSRFPEGALTDPNAAPMLEGTAPVDVDWVSHYHDEHEPSVRAWLADAADRPAGSAMTDHPPAPTDAPVAPPTPRRPGQPWTVRVAAWSARHRWPVAALWFVLTIGVFVVSLANGGTNTAEAVTNDQNGRPDAESARAYDVFGAAANPDTRHRTLVILADPSRTIDDPAYAAELDAILAAMTSATAPVDGTSGPLLTELVDPRVAPPEAGLVSPDRTAVRIAATVPGDGAALDQRLQALPGLLDTLRAAHPGLAIHGLDGTIANHDIQELVNGGLDQSLRLTIPLTFVILLVAFGAVVAAIVPLVLAVTALLGGVRRPRALQPARRAGQPVREPAHRADRAGRGGRLLAVHDHPLPNRAAPWPRQARGDPRSPRRPPGGRCSSRAWRSCSRSAACSCSTTCCSDRWPSARSRSCSSRSSAR